MSWQVGGNCFLSFSSFSAIDSQTLSTICLSSPSLSLSLLTSVTLLLCPSLCVIGSVAGLSEGRRGSRGRRVGRREKGGGALLVGEEGKQIGVVGGYKRQEQNELGDKV